MEPDSTFRTGKEWAGVWTRDISYSIILAQATLQPRSAMKSLLRKVSPEGRIIQDTGTGGAYPCSTDRVIWAVAAWEIYKVTGDAAWLKKVYPIIQHSLADDAQNVPTTPPPAWRAASRRFWTGASRPTPAGCSRPTSTKAKTWVPTPFIFRPIPCWRSWPGSWATPTWPRSTSR